MEIPRIFGGYLEASRHLEVYRILKEEAIYNEALILRWFMRLNLQPYRLRVSGHYYPYHLRTKMQSNRGDNINAHVISRTFIHYGNLGFLV